MNIDLIKESIYEIRGVQVMIDSDLARLYECTNGTKDINKAVKRNINRFPEDFYFQLTEEEVQILKYIKSNSYNESLRFQNGTSKIELSRLQTVTLNNDLLRSQFGTSKNETRGGRQYLPYAFTEQGVAMLASVLRTEKASKMSVSIMRAFVIMRKYISSDLIEQKYINNLVIEHDSDIKLLKESFDKLEEKSKASEIYFNGQIFDAYNKIQEIFNTAKEDLIVIDSYADHTLLNIIKKLSIKVTIITKEDNLLTKQDIEEYNKQYHNLNVIYSNDYHDRYFILDTSTIYHCGASINRIGYKTFSINLISDSDIIDKLLNKVLNE